MADKKITQLTQIVAIDTADALAIVDDSTGETKHVLISQLDTRFGSTPDHDTLTGVDPDDHHAAFVGLEDNAGTAIAPSGADDRIKVTDDGKINADATLPNELALTIDESQVDHGSLAGLADDDHAQYILVDGSRDFTGVQVGVYPQNQSHLATKEYVDDTIPFSMLILDKDLTAPPGSPTIGDRYIVAATATGDWATYEDYIAEYNNLSEWEFTQPTEGFTVWVADEDQHYVYDGAAWVTFSSTGSSFAGLEDNAGTDIDPDVVDNRIQITDDGKINADASGGNLALSIDESQFTHSTIHERGGAAEIDGDHLDIDFTPSNYTPSTTPAEAANVDDLAAHLAGIDDQFAAAPASHASSHERGGTDEIDGDHLDIDFTPSNYSPSIVPAEAANVDDLAAHLYGIDQKIAAGATTWTPTLTQSGSVTFSTGFVRYQRVFDVVVVHARLAVTGSGTAGNAIVVGGLPVQNAVATGAFGNFYIYDNSATQYYVGTAVTGGGLTNVAFREANTGGFVGAAPSFALGSGDTISFTFTYFAV